MAILNHYGTTDQGIPLVILPPPQDGKEVPLPAITYPTSLEMGSPELAEYLQKHYYLCTQGKVIEWYSSNGILMCKMFSPARFLIWDDDGWGSGFWNDDLKKDFEAHHGK